MFRVPTFFPGIDGGGSQLGCATRERCMPPPVMRLVIGVFKPMCMHNRCLLCDDTDYTDLYCLNNKNIIFMPEPVPKDRTARPPEIFGHTHQVYHDTYILQQYYTINCCDLWAPRGLLADVSLVVYFTLSCRAAPFRLVNECIAAARHEIVTCRLYDEYK